LLGRLAAGLGALVAVTIPLAVAWAALGVWLGRRQERQTERNDRVIDRGRLRAAPEQV
jgi:AAA family ATP:ADP antiporter